MAQKVTLEDVGRIRKSLTNLYHLLRHYSECDPSYTDTLIGEKYEYYDYTVGSFVSSVITTDTITEAYKTQGSKFFPNVLGMETPESLFDTILEIVRNKVAVGELEWVEREGIRNFEFVHLCENDIGYLGVVPVDTLASEEREQIRRVERGKEGVVINVVSIDHKIPTNQLAIAVGEQQGSNDLYITAYPGTVGGPELPSASQTEAEQKMSEEYWNKQVFIE